MNRSGKDIVHWIKAAVLVVLLVVLSVLVWRELPQEWLDPVWIDAFLKRMGILAPLAYILIRTIGIVATVVPNAPLDIAGGVVFGPFWGTVYALIGSELGAVACFILARILGRDAIARLLHRDVAFGDAAQRQMAPLAPRPSRPVFLRPGQLRRRPDQDVPALCTEQFSGDAPGTILLNYYGKSLFSGFRRCRSAWDWCSSSCCSSYLLDKGRTLGLKDKMIGKEPNGEMKARRH
jgi:hypothetical protein